MKAKKNSVRRALLSHSHHVREAPNKEYKTVSHQGQMTKEQLDRIKTLGLETVSLPFIQNTKMKEYPGCIFDDKLMQSELVKRQLSWQTQNGDTVKGDVTKARSLGTRTLKDGGRFVMYQDEGSVLLGLVGLIYRIARQRKYLQVYSELIKLDSIYMMTIEISYLGSNFPFGLQLCTSESQKHVFKGMIELN